MQLQSKHTAESNVTRIDNVTSLGLTVEGDWSYCENNKIIHDQKESDWEHDMSASITHLLFQGVEGQLDDVIEGTIGRCPVCQQLYQSASVPQPRVRGGFLAMLPRLGKEKTLYCNAWVSEIFGFLLAFCV